MYSSFIFLLLSLCYCFGKEHIKRTIKLKHIPIACSHNSTVDIIHVTATNNVMKTDVIHYLWTGVGRPTIVITHTMKPLTVKFHNKNICQKGDGKSFSFTPEDTDITGIIINKVFSFQDLKDKVSLENVHTGPDIAQHFNWTLDPAKTQTDMATFHGKSSHYNGSIIFKTKAHGEFGHSDLLPHNPITANLTEFTLILDRLQPQKSKTRYAVEVLFFSSAHAGNGHFDTVKYIDDEFTPGVFDIWAAHFSENAFSTWKPVSYKSISRSRQTQGFATNYAGNSRLKEKGTLSQYKKDKVWTIVDQQENLQFFAMNLTFGVAKDGWYNANPHTSWVGLTGVGTPPTDSISSTTLAIIIGGVGSPAVAILMAVFYLVVRKVRLTRKNKYAQIN